MNYAVAIFFAVVLLAAIASEISLRRIKGNAAALLPAVRTFQCGVCGTYFGSERKELVKIFCPYPDCHSNDVFFVN